MRPRTPIEERFWSKVQKGEPNECWEYQGSLNSKGYGRIARAGIGNGSERAHRVSALIHFGSIPDGLVVCHKCNNKRCVNPHHLYLATPSENVKDYFRDIRKFNKEAWGWVLVLNFIACSAD